MIQWLLPVSSQKLSDKELFRLRFLAWTGLCSLGTMLFYFFQYNFFYKEYIFNWVMVPGLILQSLSFVTLKMKRPFEIPASLNLSGTLVFLIGLLYSAGGIQAPGIFWLSMVPILFGVYFGKNGAILGLSVSILITILFFIGDLYGPIPSILKTPEEYAQAKFENMVLFITSSMLIIMGYLRLVEKVEGKLHKEKEKFENVLRLVVHDIANPLTLAKHYLPKMGCNDKPEYGKINKAIITIEEIMNSVRTMKAVEDEKISVDLKVIPIIELFSDFEFLFAPKLAEKNLTFEIYKEGINESVLVDKSVFKNQIINNLISNAIKFSKKGGIISIRLTKEDKNFIFEIQDYGIGIPKELIPDLFSVEKKTSRKGTDGEKGTGFGLPLVQLFISLMQGQIEVESIDGKGTLFRVIMPLQNSTLDLAG